MVVTVDGAEIFYTRSGSGVTVVMPALLGTAVLEALTPAPLRERFQFIYVDLRGAGRSTGLITELTFDRIAADLDAVAEHAGAARLVVLGYSIAGVIAIEYARRSRSRVSHVIVSGTPPTGDMTAMSAAGAQYFEEQASDARKAILRENMAQLSPGTPPTQTIFAQTPVRFFDAQFDVRPLFTAATLRPGLLEHIMGVLTPRWDVSAEPVDVPLLVAHGRHDYVVPLTMWNGVVNTLPRATLHVFERSGHQPFFEEPAPFAEVVTGWMEQLR